MADDMTIEEIIRRLVGHGNRRAYYSGYDDEEAKKDQKEAEEGIAKCTALLNQRIAAMNEAMAIITEIATSDPLISDYSPKLVRSCRYCGLALVSEHYEFPPFRRAHADDCLYVRVKALVEGA